MLKFSILLVPVTVLVFVEHTHGFLWWGDDEENPVIECPDGWTPSQTTSTCIRLVEDPSSWEDARANCKVVYGADLVKIVDSSMNNLVVDMVTQKGSGYWIGLHDSKKNGHFKWLDDRSDTLSFTNWTSGQPDNMNDSGSNKGVNCVEIGMMYNSWNHFPCDAPLSYICEKDN